MNLSRYILKYSTDDGTLYFNTKTNHSFGQANYEDKFTLSM